MKDNWFKHHPIWTGIIGLFLFLFIVGSLLPEDSPSPTITGKVVNEDFSERTEEFIEEPQNLAPESQEEYFLVTKVIDGDTVHINGESTRLICIDTPERGEEGYLKSTEFLESLILNKEVIVEEDITKRDKYNRLLYYIFTKKGDFVNEIMVRQGYAEAYPYYPDTRLCPQILEAEKQAKADKIGIWAEEPKEEEQIIKDDCSSNIYNCGDFNTHAEAQEVFEMCGGVSNDVHDLDRDNDGSACETLP